MQGLGGVEVEVEGDGGEDGGHQVGGGGGEVAMLGGVKAGGQKEGGGAGSHDGLDGGIVTAGKRGRVCVLQVDDHFHERPIHDHGRRA